MGFDQMMTFYNHFAVEKSQIKVVFNNTSSGPLKVGIRIDADSTLITDPDQLVEFGGLSYDTLEGKAIYGMNKELTLRADIAKVQGIPRKNITTDPNLRGTAAASPAEITYYHVVAWDPTGSSGGCTFQVVIDYIAIFTEPRDATKSLTRAPAIFHGGERKEFVPRHERVEPPAPKLALAEPCKWMEDDEYETVCCCSLDPSRFLKIAGHVIPIERGVVAKPSVTLTTLETQQ